ncbi:hypothetical protein [Blastococcus sp. PRF04-17]|uniref:hypothetical protein n=1 Tax=Blastococcus sp. PRF04-17 TaxID=2933797 RepID=UPI001FF15DB0|nr:hypothetical protein [Blastococcus sp. PRF04-17]UOY02109.1 hypothetical protein MVA48_01605 [Blastococcus sp. PRF04-17]
MTVVQTREYVVPAPRAGERVAEEPRPEVRRRTRPMSQYWDHRTARWETRPRD